MQFVVFWQSWHKWKIFFCMTCGVHDSLDVRYQFCVESCSFIYRLFMLCVFVVFWSEAKINSNIFCYITLNTVKLIFYLAGLHYLAHFDFGYSKKKQQQQLKLSVTLHNIINYWTFSHIMCLKSYWIKLFGWKNDQLVHFGTKFNFYFFPIATLWNYLKWNVIQQINKIYGLIHKKSPQNCSCWKILGVICTVIPGFKVKENPLALLFVKLDN